MTDDGRIERFTCGANDGSGAPRVKSKQEDKGGKKSM